MASDGIRKPVLLIDKQTGEVARRFESISAASRRLGMPEQTVSYLARAKTLHFGRHVIRFEDDWEGFEDISAKRNRPVVVTYPSGGEGWFCNARDAAKALHCDRTAVLHALARDPAELFGMPIRRQRMIGKKGTGGDG